MGRRARHNQLSALGFQVNTRSQKPSLSNSPASRARAPECGARGVAMLLHGRGGDQMRQPDAPSFVHSIHDVEIDLMPAPEQSGGDPARFRSVALPLLLPGTQLTLHTDSARYRMVVIDGSERRVTITGGKLFPESTEAELIGASDDESVKVGWIVEGFQLELLTARGPILTPSVQSVDVD